REALQDRRVHVVIGDARNVLLASDRTWDVIVSEPSNPWIGGMATLFTEEFYALARSRLAPGGVVVAWGGGYWLRAEGLQVVVRSCRTASPATTVWNAHGLADFMLLGAVEARPLDLAAAQAKWDATPALREDFQRLGFRSPAAFLADFLLAEPDAARLTLGAGLNTDDRPPLEFSTPQSLHGDTAATKYRVGRALPTLQPARLSGGGVDTAAARVDLGVAYLRKDLAAEAAAQFERALALDPKHALASSGLGRAQLALNLPLRAIDSLEAAARLDPRLAEPHV